MGLMSRRKGANGEREVVNLLKSRGIPSKRISLLETNGLDKGDIQVGHYQKGSVKLGSHVPKFLYDALGDCDFLFSRRDKQKWLVTMPLEWFLLMYPERGEEVVETKTVNIPVEEEGER